MVSRCNCRGYKYQKIVDCLERLKRVNLDTELGTDRIVIELDNIKTRLISGEDICNEYLDNLIYYNYHLIIGS